MQQTLLVTFVVTLLSGSCWSAADEVNPQRAKAALEKAVRFYRQQVGVQGGSVFQVSSDLKLREGENKVGPQEVWIEPPATSAVGMAYLQGWQLTGETLFRDAMLETAECLIRGQLESGGWTENIEFDPDLRPKYAYRVDRHQDFSKLINRTTFDDNKSQSSLKFLMLVDRELEFKNPRIHEAALYALEAFVHAQYPLGAWPQQYTKLIEAAETGMKQARFPETWSRTYTRSSYSQFYTLNDNTLSDLIDLMLTAYHVYQDERWLNSALRGGKFLLVAQLPEPQPGWAQQYNSDLEPVWARKFEPPAISGLESQGVLEVLLTLYDQTGDLHFLKPVPRAIEYYQSIRLDEGQLARFYEIGTDRPLYFTREYELVYTDDDLPTHYGFKVGSKLERIAERHQKLLKIGPSKSSLIRTAKKPKLDKGLVQRATLAIQTLDERGAWVESGKMKNFPEEQQPQGIIVSRTYARQILTLAEYLAAVQ